MTRDPGSQCAASGTGDFDVLPDTLSGGTPAEAGRVQRRKRRAAARLGPGPARAHGSAHQISAGARTAAARRHPPAVQLSFGRRSARHRTGLACGRGSRRDYHRFPRTRGIHWQRNGRQEECRRVQGNRAATTAHRTSTSRDRRNRRNESGAVAPTVASSQELRAIGLDSRRDSGRH